VAKSSMSPGHTRRNLDQVGPESDGTTLEEFQIFQPCSAIHRVLQSGPSSPPQQKSDQLDNAQTLLVSTALEPELAQDVRILVPSSARPVARPSRPRPDLGPGRRAGRCPGYRSSFSSGMTV